jgi:hypothetical protein
MLVTVQRNINKKTPNSQEMKKTHITGQENIQKEMS